MIRIADIKLVREKLGCGLSEARDAVSKYGTADAAIEALSPKPTEAMDPYARAVADRERWHAKSSEYRNALMRILNITTDAHTEIREIAANGIRYGDLL